MSARKTPRPARRASAAAPQPRLVQLAAPKGPAFPAGRMLIASPDAVAAVVAHVPAGRVLRLGDLRAALARAFGADYTCPLTTGIFLRQVAEAAHAGGAEGRVPWWRVVRDDGALLDKLPGGAAGQRARLAAERVPVPPGRRLKVADVGAHAWAVPATVQRAARRTAVGWPAAR